MYCLGPGKTLVHSEHKIYIFILYWFVWRELYLLTFKIYCDSVSMFRQDPRYCIMLRFGTISFYTSKEGSPLYSRSCHGPRIAQEMLPHELKLGLWFQTFFDVELYLRIWSNLTIIFFSMGLSQLASKVMWDDYSPISCDLDSLPWSWYHLIWINMYLPQHSSCSKKMHHQQWLLDSHVGNGHGSSWSMQPFERLGNELNKGMEDG